MNEFEQQKWQMNVCLVQRFLFSYKDNNITQQHAGQSRDILKLLWDNILHWSNQKRAKVNNLQADIILKLNGNLADCRRVQLRRDDSDWTKRS